jgi:hypothetical protein
MEKNINVEGQWSGIHAGKARLVLSVDEKRRVAGGIAAMRRA